MTLPLVALALVACGGDKGSSSSASAAASAPAAPYTGPLDAERILSVKDTVKPFEKWDEALAKLKAKVGEPTLVKDKKHWWAVADAKDGSCAYFYVDQQADGSVGTVMSPMKVAKDGPEMNVKQCQDAAKK